MAFGMRPPRGASGGGALSERMVFESRAEVNDGAGNTEGIWTERFRRRAARRFLKGSEKVLEAMSTGVQPAVVTVRRCSQTVLIDTNWRLRDARGGTLFNIHAVEPSEDRAWIELIVSSGGPTG